ncbi:MAG: glycosyltransferase family 9 protein, partial [Chitinispirillaceae bacterium]|nr:glycosyltransferase family 9 protein [Chitinispirillaceae bacterium]
MKVLCICPIGIGNYLLMYPACRQLKKARPDAELHLLALRSAITDLAADDTLWMAVHSIDPTRAPSLARQFRIVRRLSRERFDASLSFFPSNTWQYNLLPFLARIPARFAFRYPLKQGASLSFLNTRLAGVDPEAHDVLQNLRLIAAFTGGEVNVEAPECPVLFTEKERDAAERYLAEKEGPERWVGIHPGSSGEHGMAA